jgi:hypothetical protein
VRSMEGGLVDAKPVLGYLDAGAYHFMWEMASKYRVP